MRVLIISPYPVFPTAAGGKIRIRALAQGLHNHGVEVDLLTPFAFGQRAAVTRDFTCPLKQFPYPFVWALLADRPFPFQFLASFHPGLRFLIQPYLSGYDIIQFEHIPYSNLLELVPPTTKVIYGTQNVEYDYVEAECSHLPQRVRRFVVNRIAKLEAQLLERADKVLIVSQEDGQRFRQLYGVVDDKFALAPNGVKNQVLQGCGDRLHERFPALRERRRIFVFSGSDVAHNRDAVEQLLAHLAPHLEGESALMIHGQVSRHWKTRDIPPHIYLDPDGQFEDYAAVDAVGLNPIRIGGGTNLKLLHYLSLGMKAVTTPFGLRGNAHLAPYVKVAQVQDFWSALNGPINAPPPQGMLHDKLSWDRISEKLARTYADLCGISDIEIS